LVGDLAEVNDGVSTWLWLLKIQNRSIWRENSLFLEKFFPDTPLKIPCSVAQGIFAANN